MRFLLAGDSSGCSQRVSCRAVRILPHPGCQVTFGDAASVRIGYVCQDEPISRRIFDSVRRKHAIEHRLTKVRNPWTNGQVEHMNRTIKDGPVSAASEGSCTSAASVS